MSIIRIKNLNFTHEGGITPVFTDVSLDLDTDWKLGLIGRNGKGKTTLLRLLSGALPSGGAVSASVAFDYFPFKVSDPSLTPPEIISGIAPGAAEWEIRRELNLLACDEGIFYRPFETLSGGEQVKVSLAALFLREGRFLLIDEPTNHLDTAARRAVAAYLNSKKGFILVSHDRVFLDACIDHVLSINRSGIELQKGNFSSWNTNRMRREQFETAENEKLLKDIDRLSAASKRTASWAGNIESTKYATRNSGLKPDRGYIGHKSAKMMKRAKQLEARAENAIKEKSELLKDVEHAHGLSLRPETRKGGVLVSGENLSLGYGGGEVFSGVSFIVKPGERVFLSGANGSGKSSIIKAVAGEDVPIKGRLYIAPGLKISYVPQDVSRLKGTLKEYILENELDQPLFKNILRRLDMDVSRPEQELSLLSDGQKKKIYLAGSIAGGAHLYLWDEPLNYVDVVSRMQIEDAVLNSGAAMLIVEHDEAFKTAAATTVVEL